MSDIAATIEASVTPKTSAGQRRLSQLDGLRGYAAFIVLISHFQSSFIGLETYPARSLAGILMRSPLRTFFDGGLQVQIFLY